MLVDVEVVACICWAAVALRGSYAICCELDLKWEVIVKSCLIIPTLPQKYKFGDWLIKELVSCFNRV